MKVRKLGKMVLREEFFAITGCLEDAMILNQMCYWSERVKDIDKFLEEEYTMLVDHVPILAHGWIYKSASELTEEMFGAISEKTMNRVLERLVKNNFLRRRVNPNPKYRFDKTYQYRVNFVEILLKLQSKNMPLSGYQIVQECAERIASGVAPIRQNDASDTQVDGAIPETTPENTNKELPLTPSKGNGDSLQAANAANGANAQVGKADALNSRPPNSVNTRTPFRAPKSPPIDPEKFSEFRNRANLLLGRRDATNWSAGEIKAAKANLETCEEDWKLLEKYYANRGKDGFYTRRSMLTLLNNWAGEIDKSRAHYEKESKNEYKCDDFKL